MGSERDNLVFAETNFTGTHYHDKSYHSCLSYVTAESSDRDEPCTFTFHVDDGERSALAKPGGDLSGIEVDWSQRCGHTARLVGISQRSLANARVTGIVA